MSKAEHLTKKFTQEIIESRVLVGDFTREDYDDLGASLLPVPDFTVGHYIRSQIDAGAFRWDKEGRLVPNYEGILEKLYLSSEQQEALRLKVVATGKQPADIIDEIIQEGLGLNEE